VVHLLIKVACSLVTGNNTESGVKTARHTCFLVSLDFTFFSSLIINSTPQKFKFTNAT
jgi:hypothetical protein